MLILVPCKTLHHGKSRLASYLDARSRRLLCEFFLCQTLSLATSVVLPSEVRVITADLRAVQIGADYGVQPLADNGAGLNQSLFDARAELFHGLAGNDDVLILPIDLPFAVPAAVERILRRPADVVIVPDTAMTGTNLLFLKRRAFSEFPFSFGPDSFERHCAAAESAAHSVEVIRDEAHLSFDVDWPLDYVKWIEATKGAIPAAWPRRRKRLQGMAARLSLPTLMYGMACGTRRRSRIYL